MAETKLSTKGMRLVSYGVISLFALIGLIFFFLSIDQTAVILFVSILLLALALYLLWSQDDIDAVSLLIFFFGTTASFNIFNDLATADYMRFIAVFFFAGISLILSNYLLNTIKPIFSSKKTLYKITLAIIFTEFFWILSLINASQIAKGAITAVIFFNLQYVAKAVLTNNINKRQLLGLGIISLLLLAVVIYRI